MVGLFVHWFTGSLVHWYYPFIFVIQSAAKDLIVFPPADSADFSAD
jgi:hypothetical protein